MKKLMLAVLAVFAVAVYAGAQGVVCCTNLKHDAFNKIDFKTQYSIDTASKVDIVKDVVIFNLGSHYDHIQGANYQGKIAFDITEYETRVNIVPVVLNEDGLEYAKIFLKPQVKGNVLTLTVAVTNVQADPAFEAQEEYAIAKPKLQDAFNENVIKDLQLKNEKLTQSLEMFQFPSIN